MGQCGVELLFPEDGSVEMKAYDRDGKLIAGGVSRLVLLPEFVRRDARVPLVYSRTLADVDKRTSEVAKTVVQLFGSTGRVQAIDRDNTVSPKFVDNADFDDKKLKTKPASTPADAG